MRLFILASMTAAAVAFGSVAVPAAAQSEVRNFEAKGPTRAAACSKAKGNASRSADNSRSVVVRFSSCDCVEQDISSAPGLLREIRWSCSVDAALRRRN